MYISGGSNVYPRETEEKILTHPAIAEVAILGVPDKTWGEVGVAVCVLRPDARAQRAGTAGVDGRQGVSLQAAQARLLLGGAAQVGLRQDHQEGSSAQELEARGCLPLDKPLEASA